MVDKEQRRKATKLAMVDITAWLANSPNAARLGNVSTLAGLGADIAKKSDMLFDGNKRNNVSALAGILGNTMLLNHMSKANK